MSVCSACRQGLSYVDALICLLILFALAIPTADSQRSGGTFFSSRAVHHAGVGPTEGAVSGWAIGVGTAACQRPGVLARYLHLHLHNSEVESVKTKHSISHTCSSQSPPSGINDSRGMSSTRIYMFTKCPLYFFSDPLLTSFIITLQSLLCCEKAS